MNHTQLERGIDPAAIAVGLNRSASTRSRQFRRNGWTRPNAHRGPGRPPLAGGYRADAAHMRAHACTVTSHVARRLQPGASLWDQVIRYLKAGYSPEQGEIHLGGTKISCRISMYVALAEIAITADKLCSN
jgi:IS30 family transposase